MRYLRHIWGLNLDFSKQHSALFCKVEMSKRISGVCGDRGGCIFLTAAETAKQIEFAVIYGICGGQSLQSTHFKRNLLSGAGSYPPFDNGLHRSNLQQPISIPLSTPLLFIDRFIYSEQVGSYKQVCFEKCR